MKRHMTPAGANASAAGDADGHTCTAQRCAAVSSEGARGDADSEAAGPTQAACSKPRARSPTRRCDGLNLGANMDVNAGEGNEKLHSGRMHLDNHDGTRDTRPDEDYSAGALSGAAGDRERVALEGLRKFDDSDRDKLVPEDSSKKTGGGGDDETGHDGEVKLRAGDKAEAKCKGSKRQYPGKIVMDNRDGTYDVKFDNGDRVRFAPEGSIKKAGGGGGDESGADVEVKLRVGDKVEAKCKGSKKHYPGKIFMDNRDGTYDVKFDDGNRDRAVPRAAIKSKSGSSSASGGKLREGLFGHP